MLYSCCNVHHFVEMRPGNCSWDKRKSQDATLTTHAEVHVSERGEYLNDLEFVNISLCNLFLACRFYDVKRSVLKRSLQVAGRMASQAHFNTFQDDRKSFLKYLSINLQY